MSNSDWPLYIVSELEKAKLLKIEDGNHGEYRPRSHEFTEQGTSFIRAADINQGRILFESASRINNTALSRIRKGIGCPGDTLLSSKGTVGKIALASLNCEPFVCSPQVTFWRSLDNEFLYYRFLYYYIHSSAFFTQIKSISGESDMAPYISLTNQRKFKIAIPNIDEQKAIAHILGTLDDKIELNQQMNQILEAMARAIFKSWFVDFEPVRAKMEGKQPVGMDTATANLFPDSFEQSELGLIPKGWRVESLDEIANFLNGLALQKYPPEHENNYLPVIKIAELRQGFTKKSGKASVNIKEEYIIQDGDIIFSWSGSLVNCIWCGGTGALNQHLFKVTSQDYPKWFYYQWINYYLPDFQFIAASKATTMGHIQRHHLSEALIIVPSSDLLLTKMDKIMNPLIEKVISNNLESRNIANIRDTLLPKLMSGEIRVKEAEKMI